MRIFTAHHMLDVLMTKIICGANNRPGLLVVRLEHQQHVLALVGRTAQMVGAAGSRSSLPATSSVLKSWIARRRLRVGESLIQALRSRRTDEDEMIRTYECSVGAPKRRIVYLHAHALTLGICGVRGAAGADRRAGRCAGLPGMRAPVAVRGRSAALVTGRPGRLCLQGKW